MMVQSFTKGFLKKTKKEEEDIAFILGVQAFKDTVKHSEDRLDVQHMDDPEILFEFLYLGFVNPHPEDSELNITLHETDVEYFVNGFIVERERYLAMDETEQYKSMGPTDDDDEDEDPTKDTYFSQLALFGHGSKPGDFGKKYNYTYPRYVEPTFIYDRFELVEKSTKKILFPEDMSTLFWDIFQTASGKEIMFYGELTNSEEDPDTYVVSGMNFPPQQNYGGYVETVDGAYEPWIFNEIILKGKKIPMQAHTHPDFSAFSSGTDERQIKQYIEDNVGNPFVIQLIVSNPRKGRYFVRWFDLENNTWEKPAVEFTYVNYDVEANYPGIFQFNAPARFEKIDYAALTSRGLGSKSAAAGNFNYKSIFEEDDEDGVDMFDKEEFDKHFFKNYYGLDKHKKK